MSKQDVENLLNSLNISLDGICDVEDVVMIKNDVDKDVESWLQDSTIVSSSSSFSEEDEDKEADLIDIASLRVKIQRLEHEARSRSEKLKHANERIRGLSVSETCSTFKVKTSGLDGKPFPSWYRCLRGSS